MLDLRLPMSNAPALSTPLHIALLGPPRITHDDRQVAFPRRQLRALFYRIAGAPQPVPRDQLSFLLWPGQPDVAARRHLTVLLTQLRRALPNPDLLHTSGDAVALHPAGAHVDTAAFRALSAHAASSGQLDALAEAVALYRGPFLDGFALPAVVEYDDWLAHERQGWERQYLDALALLVEGFAERGAYHQAIDAAQRALAVDALSEAMHRHLIALYAALGDRSAALRQFERCAVVLERELHVSPLPETRAVYEAVRAGRLPLPRRPAGSAALAGRGGPEQPPAPRATPAPTPPARRLHGLPATPNPLIGRADESAQLRARLRDPALRLLTLCGAGGSGKTRLALHAAWDAADQFADGAVFVALAALRDPALVVPAIARACELEQTSASALAAFLRPRQLLLLLDNCEHLPQMASAIGALLAEAPRLRVLATSRAALGVHGEHLVALPPLPLPNLAQLPPLPALAAVPSLALLLARTRALNPGFALSAANAADLAAICVRLDGLPLALELAAARLKLLAPRDLLRRLDHRLALLTGGARDLPDRQRTLHATIDWSYRLLDIAEQLWFERCSVFVGGWTIEAAEALGERLRWHSPQPEPAPGASAAMLDVLAALADKQLVQVSSADDGTTRFTMLETIREFADERLHARGGFAAAAQAHADLYVPFVAQREAAGLAPNTPPWIAAVEGDYANLRAALRWHLDHNDAEQALGLGTSLNQFWYWRDYEREGLAWIDEIIAGSGHVRSQPRAKALYMGAVFSGAQGEMNRAVALYEQNLQLCEELGLLPMRCSALGGLAIMRCRQGDFVGEIALLEQALAIAQQLAEPRRICGVCANFAGVLADQAADIPRAIALYEDSLAIARAQQWPLMESTALAGMGIALALSGGHARAASVLAEALRIQQQIKASGALAWTLQFLGVLAYQQAQYGRARQYFAESLTLAEQTNSLNTVPMSLEGLAGVAALAAQPARAAQLLGHAEVLRDTLQIRLPPLERPHNERILAAVRAQLPAAALHAAWQRGRSLPTEQAIADAKDQTRIGPGDRLAHVPNA